MTHIVITTQADFDALPDRFEAYTIIEIRAKSIVISGRRDNSSIEARDNSSVRARDNSSIEARDNSSIEAWGNSSIVARDNSSVQARDNSSVQAWENSSVQARGNSSIQARDNSFCRIFCAGANVELYGASAAMLQADGACALRKSDQAKILQQPEPEWTVPGWLERAGILEVNGHVIVYKRVSADLRTQEEQPWETTWCIGTTLTHPYWCPYHAECKGGKFHGCSRPYFCDEFRSVKGDRYIAVQVAVTDLYAWKKPRYPHKIAFRSGTVLYECDKHGRQVTS